MVVLAWSRADEGKWLLLPFLVSVRIGLLVGKFPQHLVMRGERLASERPLGDSDNRQPSDCDRGRKNPNRRRVGTRAELRRAKAQGRKRAVRLLRRIS
jgi:hypothetical protein